MDRIENLMLHFRDAEGITLFLCYGTERIRLAAKADVGDNVISCTAAFEYPQAPSPDGDLTNDVLEAMLSLIAAVRRERRKVLEAAVQPG
ncbi:MAG TPA: hypothetical protein V6D05_08140 [Stenomitos sp.]